MALILNFTDSYKKEERFCSGSNTVIDFTSLSGTTGYCTEEAAMSIREKLKNYSYKGEHYLDDGNHHYLTRFFLEKIEEPFNLVVFDHHTDMQPPSLLPLLSCGNWILDSMHAITDLRGVYLYGIPDDTVMTEELSNERVHIITEPEANEKPSVLPSDGLPVYISIDEDVLDYSEFKAVWDQGSMKRVRLNEWISYINKNRRVLGIDFCG